MDRSFADALHGWQNFYFMIGGAAAALVGVLFVAVSLGAHLVSAETATEISTFVTPILFSFLSVLGIACLMLVPTEAPAFIAAGLLAVGAVGLGRVVQVLRGMLRLTTRQVIHRSHWLWHVSLPGLSYALLAGTAAGLLADEPALGLPGVAAAVVMLLFNGIWRSWELVLWIAQRRAV